MTAYDHVVLDTVRVNEASATARARLRPVLHGGFGGLYAARGLARAPVRLMQGLSIAMVGKLLGHSQIQTAMRYVHPGDDPGRAAAAQVAGALGQTLTANIAPLERKSLETSSPFRKDRANNNA